MIKVYSYEIVFREVPNEVTLALNLSMCPHHCDGCHSPWLWSDDGTELTIEKISEYLLAQPKCRVTTCVAFMGGDNDIERLFELNREVKSRFPNIKTCWYSGFNYTDVSLNYYNELKEFDYLKFGPYMKDLGGLDSLSTNQVFFKRLSSRVMENITKEFQKYGKSDMPQAGL